MALLLLCALLLGGCLHQAGYLSNPTGSGDGVAVFRLVVDFQRGSDEYVYLIRYRGLDGPLRSASIQGVFLPVGPSPLVGTLPADRLDSSDSTWSLVLQAGTDSAPVELSGSLDSAYGLSFAQRESLRDAIGEVFTARLAPNSEMPPFGGSDLGEATVVLDPEARVIVCFVEHPPLTSPVGAVRLHLALPGGRQGVLIELPIRSGAVVGRIDEPSLVAAGISGGFDEAAAAVRSGQAFVDVASRLVPRGELRGALAPYDLPPPEEHSFDIGSGLSLLIGAALLIVVLMIVALFVGARLLRRFIGPGLAGGRALVDDRVRSWMVAALVVAAGLVILPDVLGWLLGRMGPLDPETFIGDLGSLPLDRLLTLIAVGAGAGLATRGRSGWAAAVAGTAGAGLIVGASQQLSGESGALVGAIGAAPYYVGYALFYVLPALPLLTLGYATVRVVIAPAVIGGRTLGWRRQVLVGAVLLASVPVAVLATAHWVAGGVAPVSIYLVAAGLLIARRRGPVRQRTGLPAES